MAHPVRLTVGGGLRRSRLTVFFRTLLAAPHLVWLTLWSIAIVPFAAFQWLWAIAAAHVEPEAHAWLARYVRYHAQVEAYVLLLANPFPPFHGRPGWQDVELAADGPARQARATVILRPVLAVPAVVFLSVLQIVLAGIAVLGWFGSLALGRFPDGMRELGAYCLRYEAQTLAYVLLLTAAYPSLAGEPAARDGVTAPAAPG